MDSGLLTHSNLALWKGNRSDPHCFCGLPGTGSVPSPERAWHTSLVPHFSWYCGWSRLSLMRTSPLCIRNISWWPRALPWA